MGFWILYKIRILDDWKKTRIPNCGIWFGLASLFYLSACLIFFDTKFYLILLNFFWKYTCYFELVKPWWQLAWCTFNQTQIYIFYNIGLQQNAKNERYKLQNFSRPNSPPPNNNVAKASLWMMAVMLAYVDFYHLFSCNQS